ncbi:MAG: class I SAM-dependent methyltransferase [Thermoanaerobaculia bacterium]
MTAADGVQCTVCASTALVSELPFGPQPPSNTLTMPGAPPEPRYPLTLGHCTQCGTIQLTERMPIEALRPAHGWLTNNEPEGHLDELAREISRLAGIDRNARVLGATYKDQSTIARLQRLGFARSDTIAPETLGAAEPFGLETIQALLSDTTTTKRLRSVYGAADVLIARHILEHATTATDFIRSMSSMLSDDGVLVLELPDSDRTIRAGNHAFIWEEHISYFTASSFRRAAAEAGATVIWFGRYRYAYEDSLVAVLRFGRDSAEAVPSEDPAAMLREFAASFDDARSSWRTRIEELRDTRGAVAIFGAGHLTAKFINFLNLGDILDCVLDDDPRKHGMLMPGSRLPVFSSNELAARQIRACISTLSPESEAKVRVRLAPFFEAGGLFVPAFATT